MVRGDFWFWRGVNITPTDQWRSRLLGEDAKADRLSSGEKSAKKTWLIVELSHDSAEIKQDTFARKNKEKCFFLWYFAHLFVSLPSVMHGSTNWDNIPCRNSWCIGHQSLMKCRTKYRINGYALFARMGCPWGVGDIMFDWANYSQKRIWLR